MDHKPRPIGAAIDIGAYEFGVAPVTGDYNHNGIVDAADYTIWRDTLGSTTNLAADGNGNHLIDAGDYDVWKANFGSSEAEQALAWSRSRLCSLLLLGDLTTLGIAP